MTLTLVTPQSPPIQRDRLVRLPAVEEMTGCKKSTIYQLMREGQFPKSIRLGSRTVAWPESAVLAWVQNRITASQATRSEGGAR